uniref:Uncharacterized protein n=1 Tax=Lygus hesperus TaxID=30085 RepID=A0A0K8SM72_LYGHE
MASCNNVCQVPRFCAAVLQSRTPKIVERLESHHQSRSSISSCPVQDLIQEPLGNLSFLHSNDMFGPAKTPHFDYPNHVYFPLELHNLMVSYVFSRSDRLAQHRIFFSRWYANLCKVDSSCTVSVQLSDPYIKIGLMRVL